MTLNPREPGFIRQISQEELLQSEECVLRDFLELETQCAPTLEQSDPVSLEDMSINMHPGFEDEITNTILNDLGEFPEEEFIKLKEEDARLDLLITEQQAQQNANRRGISFISGNPNNE